MSDDDLIRRGDAIAAFPERGLAFVRSILAAIRAVQVGTAQPSPDVAALVEALESILKASLCSGSRETARAALARVKGPTEYERKVAQIKEDFPNGI